MVHIYSEKDVERFNEEVVFFCNGCGELHYNGQYDLEEEQLPEELKRAYRKLWSEGTGSYCYLCQFRGKSYITLCNEFTCEDYVGNMDELRTVVIRNAGKIADLLEVDAEVLVTAYKEACCDMSVYVLLDPYTSYAYFEMVAETLNKFIYEKDDIPFFLVQKEVIRKSDELVSMILDLKENEEIIWYEYDSYDREDGITYCASKVVWRDSCLALIGGFGGEVRSCWLPGATLNPELFCNEEDEENVRKLVDEFYQLIHMPVHMGDVYIHVEKKKNGCIGRE